MRDKLREGVNLHRKAERRARPHSNHSIHGQVRAAQAHRPPQQDFKETDEGGREKLEVRKEYEWRDRKPSR